MASAARASAPVDGAFDHDAAERMFFARQTIQNACGTQALLSVLLNADVDIGPHLREFKEFTAPLPPDVRPPAHTVPFVRMDRESRELTGCQIRGECLSNSELIRAVHNSFARASPFADETEKRAATDDDDLYHFIAYAPVDGTLYELDGLREAPISHGPCAGWRELPEKVVPVIERRIGRHPAGEIRFNLLAMIKDPRERASEIGDGETVAAEERKRLGWRVENTLRRHNFVPFVAELMKGVVRAKKAEGEESYKSWIEEAKGRTKERIEKGKKGKGTVD
jgi:ubiquitin carboxyl-terminal hydrolase L5